MKSISAMISIAFLFSLDATSYSISSKLYGVS